MDMNTAFTAQFLAKNRAILNVTDSDAAMVVRYIGAQDSGTFAVVAAAEELVFKHGALAAEIADVSIQIGATPGSIDVSNALGNTMGEVVDHINASANWEARLLGALRTDIPAAGGTSHIAYAAAAAKTTAGLLVCFDTTEPDIITAAICDGAYNAKIGGDAFVSDSNKYYSIMQIFSMITHGGAGLVSIYEVNEATNTETLIAQWAGAATTVEQTKDFFIYNGGLGADKGKIFKVRVAATAMTAGKLDVMFRSLSF